MMEQYPDLDQLAVINAAHAPNWTGNTLLQRVANQINRDCADAFRSGDTERATRLANAAGNLQRLALAPDHQSAYEAALEMFSVDPAQ